MPAARALAAFAMLPVLALAACGGSGIEAGNGQPDKGEVLGGTISDAMLPLDTVRSQSAPAEPEALPDDPADTADDPAGADGPKPAARDTAPEPEADAAAEATAAPE